MHDLAGAFISFGAILFFAAGYLWAKISLYTQQDDCHHQLAEAKTELTQKSAEIQHLNERIKEMDDTLAGQLTETQQQLSQANAERHRQAEEITRLNKQIEDLRKENAGLRSLGLVYEAAPAQPVFSEQPKSLEMLLESVLGLLSIDYPGTRSVALADPRGRLIAGIGKQHAGGLAALGGVFSELIKKLQGMLHLNKIDEFTLSEINGEHKTTIIIRPLSMLSDKMYLVALFVGAAPDDKTINQVLKEASDIITGT